MLLALSCEVAQAQDVLRCETGSGVWNRAGNGAVLDGVLCHRNHESASPFYRLDFDAKQMAYAPAIPNVTGQLRYLFDTSGERYYADDVSVYVVSPATFKVISKLEWAGAQVVPLGPDADEFRAVWTKTEEGSELHLLQSIHGKMTEVLTAQLSSEPPIAIVWQPKRLVVLEKDRLLFWMRPGMEEETSEPSAEAGTTGQAWDVLPIEAEIDPPLIPGHYQLDEEGLMVLNRDAKRLAYFRFGQASWTPASINATAQIHGLGPGTKHAMGVTNDMNTVRIVARGGVFLKNRFEAKYWKLPQDPSVLPVIGQDDLAALDGGSNNRVQTIDTTEMTWRRLALIEYPTPGRMMELKNDILISVHDSGPEAMILWHARTGEKVASLQASKLEAIQFGAITEVQSLPHFPRYQYILSQSGQFVLFDKETGELSAPASAEKVQWAKFPRVLQMLPDGVAIQRHTETGPAWDIFPAHGKPYTQTLDGLNSNLTELQTPKEKWYGYCVHDTCYAPDAPEIQLKQAIPSVSVKLSEDTHAPGMLSWILTSLAFLAMFGIMLWRRGFGKKSRLTATHASDELVHNDIYDKKNRRYISDRDYRYFLAPQFYAKPAFRVVLSIALGLGTGLAVAASTFYDDSITTFMSRVVVLGMPVTAVTWIITSWTFWNRYYLLRFGNITEGKWLNCSEPNPSIIYDSGHGKCYELNNRQWYRIDFVPMVIFDPARPNFAIQYTGGCSHAVIPQGNLDGEASPACCFDFYRLSAVALLLAASIFGTQALFKMAYPNPISAWQLDNIAQKSAKPDAEKTFTMACLEQCEDANTVCHAQCHQRQLKLVLEQAGMDMQGDPEMTTAQFLQIHRDEVAKARAILLDNSDLSCVAREAKLAEISLWTDRLNTSFWQTYADIDTYRAAQLQEIYQGLKNDATLFKTLCDADLTCAQSAQHCPAPPVCSGHAAQLKKRICTFEAALHIPEIAVPETGEK